MERWASVSGRAGRVAGYATPGRVAAIALLVAALSPPSLIEAGPGFCPFRLSTGLPCPACGLTRSVVALVHGDLGASLYFHPLGLATVLVFVALVLFEVARWPRPAGRAPAHVGGSAPWATLLTWAGSGTLPWIAVGAFLAVWVVRLPLYLLGAWTY